MYLSLVLLTLLRLFPICSQYSSVSSAHRQEICVTASFSQGILTGIEIDLETAGAIEVAQ